MICGISLSALSVFVALVGLCMNLLVTTPFTKHMVIDGGSFSDKFSEKKAQIFKVLANVGNTLLVIGTVGQLVSLFLK